MTDALITLHEEEQGIVILQMQDQAKKNALGTAFVEKLTEALHQVAKRSDARVCVLRGLEEVFCAGGDEEMLLALAQGEIVASDIMLSRTMLEVPIPTHDEDRKDPTIGEIHKRLLRIYPMLAWRLRSLRDDSPSPCSCKTIG